jgi:hypothetical protein
MNRSDFPSDARDPRAQGPLHSPSVEADRAFRDLGQQLGRVGAARMSTPRSARVRWRSGARRSQGVALREASAGLIDSMAGPLHSAASVLGPPPEWPTMSPGPAMRTARPGRQFGPLASGHRVRDCAGICLASARLSELTGMDDSRIQVHACDDVDAFRQCGIGASPCTSRM